MFLDALKQIRLKKKVLFTLIVVFSLVVVGIIIIMANQPRFSEYKPVHTTLHSQRNFAHLSGQNIYAYSGAAFYSMDIKNGGIKVLHSGTKLPQPKTINWANEKGALMTFDSSFTGTGVYEQLRNLGQAGSDTGKNYIWYIDFASGKLTLVSRAPLLNGLAFYSERDKGIYFLTAYVHHESDHEEAPFENEPALQFFNIAAVKSEMVREQLELVDVQALQACADTSYRACVVARKKSAQSSLWVVGVSNSKVSDVFESKARLLTTSSPNLFIVSSKQVEENNLEEEVGFAPSDTYLYDLTTKQQTKLDYKLAGERLITNIVSDKELYALTDFSRLSDVEYDKYTSTLLVSDIKSGKFARQELSYSDEKVLNEPFVTAHGYGNGGLTLASLQEGDQILVAPKDAVLKIYEQKNSRSVELAVRNCRGGNEREVRYFDELKQFKVYFPEDANFAKSIRTFADCIVKDPTLLVGYDFRFVGTSPTSGRITTD